MPITILLRCDDLARTRAYYRDALGFATADTAENTLTVSRFDAKLLFTQADLWKSPPALTGTIYFAVPDPDAFHAEVAGKATIAWGPGTMSYGTREFAVVDCNGYLLAFAAGVASAKA